MMFSLQKKLFRSSTQNPLTKIVSLRHIGKLTLIGPGLRCSLFAAVRKDVAEFLFCFLVIDKHSEKRLINI